MLSAAEAVTFTRSTASALTVPVKTASPFVFRFGVLSPVTGASSMALSPSITSLSAATRSPGRTSRTSPIASRSAVPRRRILLDTLPLGTVRWNSRVDDVALGDGAGWSRKATAASKAEGERVKPRKVFEHCGLTRPDVPRHFLDAFLAPSGAAWRETLVREPGVNEKADARTRRFDLAARAAWLYYIKRRTQDEIATDLGVSRPNAQRLVALAISEGLIKFRLDHPMLKSMELGERMRERYGLDTCEVAPSVQGQSERVGVTLLAAKYIEMLLALPNPQILALGTGRTLLDTVREVISMERGDHKVVSAVGNLTRDGRASPYDVAIRLADRVGAQCYPLPLPVLTDTREECEFLKAQRGYCIIDALVRDADAEVLGVGSIGATAPLLIDGFVTPEELSQLEKSGAVGELRSHPIDAGGQLLDDPLTRRLTAVRPVRKPRRPTVLVVAGRSKLTALAAALAGGYANRLVVDEPTAVRLLDGRC